jgi:putative membrane-bound dehydrogenase-like protein
MTLTFDRSTVRLSALLLVLHATTSYGQFTDPNADPNALPIVPPGFTVTVFAREPLVRQPCSMAFDADGRLFIGMGPQYRSPTPETPGDSVVLVQDSNGDGQADTTKVFATGFNAIQGLAWHGDDLWIANAPDFTLVRDINGDDEADEYVRIYTDLGNLEHGLHGLCWAPDGKLYMSKGNSKGLTEPGRVAPRPFRELWGVEAPPGIPDLPEPQTFTPETYQHTYHDPTDDWGVSGGILRCDDGGKNLEIVSRGLRNPWDIAFDSGFTWLATDNDQTQGDRVYMPFWGAHLGWNHPWGAHWSDQQHLPTAPISGPLFEGSGTGLVFGRSPQFPPEYRKVFFINDWLSKTTFAWKPAWDGALVRPAGGQWQPFIEGGTALYRPTDIEFGPDGALWILGWSSGYGAEYEDGKVISQGRVFRVTWDRAPQANQNNRPGKPLADWTIAELVREFVDLLPVRRIDAQDELVRRGHGVIEPLVSLLNEGALSEDQETWCLWTLGRQPLQDGRVNEFIAERLRNPSTASLNQRLQAIRILARRATFEPLRSQFTALIEPQLRDPAPRARAAAVLAIAEAKQRDCAPMLVEALASEDDRVTYYAAWKGLLELMERDAIRQLLGDDRPGIRQGALLALLEVHALGRLEVTALTGDPNDPIRGIAESWLEKSAGGLSPHIAGKPIDVSPPVAELPFVTDLRVGSGRSYEVIPQGVRPGARVYIDRNYTLERVPDDFIGAELIRTSNEDDGSSGDEFLKFTTALPVRVSVAFDTRATQFPGWLSSFERTDAEVKGDHWSTVVFSRVFPAGPVALGGNTDDGAAGGKSNYLVLLQPLPFSRQPHTADKNEVLTLLTNADVHRGEILFRHSAGAGCYKCHSLDSVKNGFGPNLSDIGRRASAVHIVQSIVEPNAVITEGFTLQTVVLADGRTVSGVLLEESGLSLTLGLTTGEAVVLPKNDIELRKSEKTSAMPPLAETLSPQQVADLVAFLLTRTKTVAPAAGKTSSGSP